MKFTKIKIGKDDDVELTRLAEQKHSKDAIETTGINPLPSFKDALAGFLPFFLRVVPALKEEELRVTSVSLGEKDGKRSLQVSASLVIEQCGDAVISMTTPRITEAPSEKAENDEKRLYLTKGDLKLIALLEEEATKYANGQTAQTELFKGDSANAKAADERMAAGEVGSTRKPRTPRTGVSGSIPAAPALH